MGYSPWSCKELDTTERTRAHAHTHTHTHTQMLGVDEEIQSIVNTLLYPNVMNRIV